MVHPDDAGLDGLAFPLHDLDAVFATPIAHRFRGEVELGPLIDRAAAQDVPAGDRHAQRPAQVLLDFAGAPVEAGVVAGDHDGARHVGQHVVEGVFGRATFGSDDLAQLDEVVEAPLHQVVHRELDVPELPGKVAADDHRGDQVEVEPLLGGVATLERTAQHHGRVA